MNSHAKSTDIIMERIEENESRLLSCYEVNTARADRLVANYHQLMEAGSVFRANRVRPIAKAARHRAWLASELYKDLTGRAVWQVTANQ